MWPRATLTPLENWGRLVQLATWWEFASTTTSSWGNGKSSPTPHNLTQSKWQVRILHISIVYVKSVQVLKWNTPDPDKELCACVYCLCDCTCVFLQVKVLSRLSIILWNASKDLTQVMQFSVGVHKQVTCNKPIFITVPEKHFLHPVKPTVSDICTSDDVTVNVQLQQWTQTVWSLLIQKHHPVDKCTYSMKALRQTVVTGFLEFLSWKLDLQQIWLTN